MALPIPIKIGWLNILDRSLIDVPLRYKSGLNHLPQPIGAVWIAVVVVSGHQASPAPPIREPIGAFPESTLTKLSRLPAAAIRPDFNARPGNSHRGIIALEIAPQPAAKGPPDRIRQLRAWRMDSRFLAALHIDYRHVAGGDNGPLGLGGIH
ncbi:MAG: hypothetical protein F4X64_02930 [Chloroflexi bacterium]|nr:hypothetical protein [Chloroflexota bacterium]